MGKLHTFYNIPAQTEAMKLTNIEEALINDIKDFIPIFGRKPTVSEVVDWMQAIYKIHFKQPYMKQLRRSARRLIKEATNGMNVPRNVRESSFIVYDERANNILTINLPERRLIDMPLLRK